MSYMFDNNTFIKTLKQTWYTVSPKSFEWFDKSSYMARKQVYH